MSESGKALLRFVNASFSYDEGKKVILDETDFSIREQTKITIMGQNGAGKSTLFKLIMGELKLTNGKINREK
jgi:ATP-binding cassette subfamily F protein 3